MKDFFVTRQGAKASRNRLLTTGEEEQLGVGFADDERPQPDAERDVERQRWAACGQWEFMVCHDEG